MAAAENNQKILHEAGENYLEVILELEQFGEKVRSVDIAAKMGVSRPSVNKAMQALKEAGMVEQQRYGAVVLTERGRVRALEVTKRHKMLKGFLRDVLHVSEQNAEQDACRMEHVISEETAEKLTAFIQTTKL